MRILVTGSRVWTREDLVRGAIQDWLSDVYGMDVNWPDIVVVHGACPTGADLHAARWCYDFDVRQETYPANWEMYGKRPFPFRNQQMVDAGADVCLAFPLGRSADTRDCMRRAQEAGITVKSFEDPAMDGYVNPMGPNAQMTEALADVTFNAGPIDQPFPTDLQALIEERDPRPGVDERFNFNPAKPPGQRYTWKDGYGPKS